MIRPLDLVTRDLINDLRGIQCRAHGKHTSMDLTVVGWANERHGVTLVRNGRKVREFHSKLGAWLHGGSPMALDLRCDWTTNSSGMLRFKERGIVHENIMGDRSSVILDHERGWVLLQWLTKWLTTRP